MWRNVIDRKEYENVGTAKRTFKHFEIYRFRFVKCVKKMNLSSFRYKFALARGASKRASRDEYLLASHRNQSVKTQVKERKKQQQKKNQTDCAHTNPNSTLLLSSSTFLVSAKHFCFVHLHIMHLHSVHTESTEREIFSILLFAFCCLLCDICCNCWYKIFVL